MSCQFKPEGQTKESCFNKCQEVNDSNCSDFCKNECNKCTDVNMCKWLSNDNQKDIDNLKANYQLLVDKIKQYQNEEKMLWNSTNDVTDEEFSSVQVHLLDKINSLNEKKEIIWNYLINEYNLNTQITDSNNKVISKNEKLIKNQKEKISKNKEVLDSLGNFNSTKKRNIEINVYKFKKMETELNLLKIVTISLLIFFVPLILGKMKILSKNISVIIYVVLLIAIIIYIVYNLYFANIGRDEQKWDEINFNKPDKNSPTQNKLLNQMSSNDKAKCLALSDMIQSENFDPADVDIGDVNKFVNNPNKCKGV